jgi:hypothetical protein
MNDIPNEAVTDITVTPSVSPSSFTPVAVVPDASCGFVTETTATNTINWLATFRHPKKELFSFLIPETPGK